MNNKLAEWRAILDKCVENYQSTRAWYEENRDSPAALDDMERAKDQLTKFVRKYGFRVVLDLLDEIDELQERRKAEAPGYPETLPCPVFLEPGLKFGKGVSTRLVLDALRRRADYYAELEGMTPEQRAKHDAGIDEFKAMLQGSQPVSDRDELPCTQLPCIRWCCRDFG
ncbi:hypothetical protein FIG92_11730 [Salmonella enterica subsp. enterica]|nr:hypothetical protein [Salmonella enterica subsp. enterica serovar Ank]EBH2789547.1 hypothetical protein [Salmonella enterica subsp. enterica serovar Ank]